MTSLRQFASRFAALFRKRQLEHDMNDEMRAHVEMLTEENLRRGICPEKARWAAMRSFGGLEQTKEVYREQRGLMMIETFWQDFRFGLRMLAKHPGFTTVAIVTLALGIGANALVFSVVNSLLLRPLPVDRPQQLVFIETKDGPSHSFPNYKALRDQNVTFAGMIGYRVAPMELEAGAGAARIWGYLATGNYFDVLGVKPAMGRFFHQEDDLQPGASPYAVLSYGSWQARFGADPGIVGKTIRINRLPYTVLGVAPEGFHGTELFYWPEIWVPMMMQPQIEVGNPWLDNRNTFNTWIIGRLKPQVTPAQATANLNSIAAELTREYPEANDGLSFKLAKPGLVGDFIGGPTRDFAFGVLIFAALVLLAACVNLASLVSARAADRKREIAIRVSIGASRARLVRQVMTEAVILSLAGGGAGYGLATLLSDALGRWRAPMDFPVQLNVHTDGRVFCFALGVSILASVFFGTAPAWNASRTDANAVLKGGEGGGRARRLAFRDVLVIVQVALCFVLVSACLLSLHGLQQALNMRLGFEPRRVSVVSLDLGLGGYSEERGRSFQRRALERIQQLPGVRSAAYSNSVPLSIDQSTDGVFSEGQPNLPTSHAHSATDYQVSPGFIQTMGIGLLQGRDFTWHDDAASPTVAIVNLAFAKQIMHTDNPIGKHFRYSRNGPLVEVIGMVEDGKYQSLTEQSRPAIFKPILQSYNSTTTLMVRSALPSTQMVGQMRQAISRLDPSLPVYGAGSLEQMLGFAFFPTRAAALALTAFGILAILLAGTGIYGLVAYAVTRRVREIGIRMAVGARPAQILRTVLGRITFLLLAGSAIGLVLALAAGQVLASVVHNASPRDPGILTAVFAIILLIGVFSCWAPTRRALRIEPMAALRYE
jgi:predicted permease